MSIKIKIAAILQEYSDIPSVIEVEGNTVGRCLDDLTRKYPAARSWLYDQNGLVRVLVSINDQDTVALSRDGLDKILNADDELQIFATIGGG